MKKYERHADWHNDFERRVAARKAAQKRRKRRDAIVLGVLLTLVAGGFLTVQIVGEGGQSPDGAARNSNSTVAPSPTTSAYDPDVVAEGLARAIVRVIATEPNSNLGLPRIQEIMTNTSFITGCVHRNYDVQTAPTRREARALDTGRGFQVIAKVLYALPDWDAQYVSVTVSVRCP